MEPILVSMVREVVNGTLAAGLEDKTIIDAKPYIRRVDGPDMLTFVWENEYPDLGRIRRYSPCTIITSHFFKKYKSIDNCTVILVDDVDKAYWSFVNYYRDSFSIPVIAITGTSGKTTTREMINHILKPTLKITSTVNNMNHCGRSLPYLLGIDHNTEAAVFETAVGGPGDVTFACRHFKPTIGMITNIGAYHLDGCRTVENYIKAKAEMVSSLSDKGILILNSDDENTKKINLNSFKGRIVYFGVKNKADFQASNIKYTCNRMEFFLNFQNARYPVSVQGYGEYQVYNALSAMAAVNELGIGMTEAAICLTSYENLPYHLQTLNGINGSILIDDTWNYNLTGLTAAFNALDNIARDKRKVVILGGMGKLGEHSAEITREAGYLISDHGTDNLIIIGDTAEAIANAVRERGGKTKINIFKDSSGIDDLLKELVDENTVVFIKCYTNEYSKPILDSFEKLIAR